MSKWGASWGASWGDSWGPVNDSSMPGRIRIPARLVDVQRMRTIHEDETLLLIAASVVAAYGTIN